MKDYYVQEYDAIKTNLGYKIPNKNLTEKQRTEVLMELVYQSNLIEGISKYWIETHSKGEEIKPKYELEDHYRAYLYTFSNFEYSNPDIKDSHFIHHLIMQNTNIKTKMFREKNNFITNKTEFIQGNPLFNQIPNLMNKLIEKINKEDLSLNKILKIHYEFETIHPYPDGNGRTGRVLLNWLTLKNKNEFYMITARDKSNYYKQIINYKKKFVKENPHIKFFEEKDLSKKQLEYFMKNKEEEKRQIIEMYNFFDELNKDNNM